MRARRARAVSSSSMLVDQRRRALERGAQRIERRRARRELLAVARQLEARVDAVADHVGEIVDVEAREVLGAIGDAERAERPRQRIVVVARRARRRARAKRGPSGSSSRPTMRSASAGIAALEEAHDGSTVVEVALAVREEVRDRRRALRSRARLRARSARRARASSPARREQAQEQLERRIGLARPRAPSRAACWRRNPVRYAVAGYGVLSWVIGGVRSRIFISRRGSATRAPLRG